MSILTDALAAARRNGVTGTDAALTELFQAGQAAESAHWKRHLDAAVTDGVFTRAEQDVYARLAADVTADPALARTITALQDER